MKKAFVYLALVVLTGCSTEQAGMISDEKQDMQAYRAVKSELSLLNSNYRDLQQSTTTRLPKWLRWLIFGAADVAGGCLGGGVAGACSASTLAWNVTKPEAPTDDKSGSYSDQSDLKSGCNDYLEYGSAGYIHNEVIYNLYNSDSVNLSSMSQEEIVSCVIAEYEKQTGTTLSATEKAAAKSYSMQAVKSFSADKTVEEYFDELKASATSDEQKEMLEVCKIVVDGLQYVSDEDTVYVKAVTQIIEKSDLSVSTKKTLTNSVSVADASAKLWNTDIKKSTVK